MNSLLLRVTMNLSYLIITLVFLQIRVLVFAKNASDKSNWKLNKAHLFHEKIIAGKGFLSHFTGLGSSNTIRPRFCNCECGKAKYPSGAGSRIVGGYVLPEMEYPWIVLLILQGTNTAEGTLITDRYVVTAASVLIGLTPYDVKVATGVSDRCFPGTITTNHSVSQIILHPNYEPQTRANDIALLKLHNFIITDRWTQQICLPKPGFNYQAMVVQAVGWGEGPTGDNTVSTSCRARRVGYTVINLQECFYMIDPQLLRFITTDKSCLGTGGQETVICSSDAGGIIQYPGQDGYFEFVGVLPDSNICSPTGYGISIFTRVNDHLSWLFSNTRDSCYCVKRT